jgi:hypothetical protein
MQVSEKKMSDLNKGLLETNLLILSHIQKLINESSRFTAASKLGIPYELVDKVAALDLVEARKIAKQYTASGVLVTCTNLNLNLDTANPQNLSLDAFFKSALQKVSA